MDPFMGSASEPPAVVAVTGGSGFIGSHLIRRLVRRGVRVRALSRRQPTPAGEVARSGNSRNRIARVADGASSIPLGAVEWITGDVAQRPQLERLMMGAAAVYHLAGCAKPWSPDPLEFERVNADGTALVCEVALGANVDVLVHTSTNLVEDDFDGPAANGATLRTLTAYQRSKIQAEAHVQAAVARGLHAVIVRPTRVFGPGPMNEANSATQVVAMYRAGLFRFRPSDQRARANYAYVRDVVRGMMLAAERGRAGSAYTLGGESVTFPELLEAIDRAGGTRPRRTLPLPPFVLKSTAAGIGFLGALSFKLPPALGVSFSPPITREWAELVTTDWPSSSRPAFDELGYRPHSLHEGLRRTLRWMDGGAKW
jgi:nucleoside-diphosphate-sugar epimerase